MIATISPFASRCNAVPLLRYEVVHLKIVFLEVPGHISGQNKQIHGHLFVMGPMFFFYIFCSIVSREKNDLFLFHFVYDSEKFFVFTQVVLVFALVPVQWRFSTDHVF